MLVEIVPSKAEYLVRAQINPQDIADVQPGQVTRISLAAYDPSRYGVIVGGCAPRLHEHHAAGKRDALL